MKTTGFFTVVTMDWNLHARSTGGKMAARAERQGRNVLALHPIDGGYKVSVVQLADPSHIGSAQATHVEEFTDKEFTDCGLDPAGSLFEQLGCFGRVALA